MRLFLSSYRFGSHVPSLLSIMGDGRRAAVIENALDGFDPEARERYRREVYDPVADFAAHGVAARPLDLRAYFGHTAALRAGLAQVDLVWVMGGNVFVLRRAMKQSGFDIVIRELLEADALAYGGFSAGAVVAGPTLHGLELMDDPFDVPAGYDEPLVWSGLGLTPFAIVPHQSQHPEAASAEKVVSYMRARRTRYRAIADGEVIVQAGNLERLAS